MNTFLFYIVLLIKPFGCKNPTNDDDDEILTGKEDMDPTRLFQFASRDCMEFTRSPSEIV